MSELVLIVLAMVLLWAAMLCTKLYEEYKYRQKKMDLWKDKE